MAKNRNTTFSAAPSLPDILGQFLAELGSGFGVKNPHGDTVPTKSQELIRRMVGGALKGDQKMIAAVLKLLDKLGGQADASGGFAGSGPHSGAPDWESIFAFYGKYRKLIDAELRRRRQIHPHYWSFGWFTPALESAPWYEDLYGSDAADGSHSPSGPPDTAKDRPIIPAI